MIVIVNLLVISSIVLQSFKFPTLLFRIEIFTCRNSCFIKHLGNSQNSTACSKLYKLHKLLVTQVQKQVLHGD